MNAIYRKLLLTLCLIALLMPQTVFFAQDVPTVAEITFQVSYVPNTETYEVYLISSETPSGDALTLTAQVTVKVPHSESAPFSVANLTSSVPGTTWSLSSRVNAPTEDPTSDYLSFTVEFPEGNYDAFEWVANQALKAFEFQSATGCMGTVALIENTDAFTQVPNSQSTNPANQIDVLFMGDGNLYAGNVGGSADCDDRSGEQSYDYYLPIINR